MQEIVLRETKRRTVPICNSPSRHLKRSNSNALRLSQNTADWHLRRVVCEILVSHIAQLVLLRRLADHHPFTRSFEPARVHLKGPGPTGSVSNDFRSTGANQLQHGLTSDQRDV